MSEQEGQEWQLAWGLLNANPGLSAPKDVVVGREGRMLPAFGLNAALSGGSHDIGCR